MWSSSRRVLQNLTTHSSVKCFSQTTCKNTVVVERWWQVPLSKEGRPPRLHPRRHRVYKLVEDTRNAPKEKMELILTQTVERLGGRGDTVFVKKSVGRNRLLPQGLAVYASPENKEKYAKGLLHDATTGEKLQTHTGQKTVELLKCTELKISKPLAVDYQLTKEIVCRHFVKKLGIVVPPHALRLPDEPIKELGEYWCDITVNGMDTVRVPLSLIPYVDPSASHQRMLKRQREEQAEQAAPVPGAAVTEAVGAAVKEEAIFEAVTEPTSVAVEAEALKESLVPPVEASTIPVAAGAPEASAASHPSEAAKVEATAVSPALEEVSSAPPALEEASATSPALEDVSAASPAQEEATAASPAQEEVSVAAAAPEKATAATAEKMATSPEDSVTPQTTEASKAVPPSKTPKKD